MSRGDLPEIELGAGSVAVGDLHLDVGNDRAVSDFVDFLQRRFDGAAGSALILLGDVFEYWVGPAQARLEGAGRVLAALAGLVGRGIAVEIVPGNRDFLLDSGFERLSGARVHPHGFLGRLPGSGARAVFIHGDELCTLDRPYQRLRRVLRSGPVRFLGPRLPWAVSGRIAERLRRASRRAVERKPTPAMAQQPAACRELAQKYDARALVCGHAHVQRDEDLGGVRWLVVDAFGGPLDAVRVDGEGELSSGCTAAPSESKWEP